MSTKVHLPQTAAHGPSPFVTVGQATLTKETEPSLLAVWRTHGLDRLLREAYDLGTLLCGISAGANCWAEGSRTDSFGPLTCLPDGLGPLPGSVCPHYDSEPGRQPSYRAAVMAGRLPAGWAVEDGAGALFEKGVLTEAVTRAPGAGLYRVEPDGSGGVREQGLPCRALTPSRSLERPEQ